MVWNHPKETSICISYGRMFQLCTSVTNARGSRSTKTWWRTAIRRRWQTIAVWEASRRFLHRLGIWISTEIQKFTDSLDHIWATPPPNPFRAFLLGGGEIRMERGNTERDVNECATVLPMCPFLIVDFHGYSCLTSTIRNSAKRCNIWKPMIKGDV